MELYILRHGLAMDRADWKSSKDHDRPLTDEGRKTTRRTAKALLALDLGFDRILSSPYLRAKDTAKIVARIIKPEEEVEFRDELAPNGNPEELTRVIAAVHKPAQRVLIVGHEPFLSRYISVLLTGQTVSRVRLKKGGLCKLQISHLRFGACAILEWLLTPRQLTRIR